MNRIKKYLGIVWMLAGPLAICLLIKIAVDEIEKNPVLDTRIQWIVFVIIFIPIAFGLVIFGYLAWKDEYANLPGSSSELEDDQ